MSFAPWQPSHTEKPANTRRVLALVVVVVVLLASAIIALLAFNFGWPARPEAAISPSPTSVALTTPQRPPGVGGPQAPTDTPLPTATAVQATPLPDTPTTTPTPMPSALASLQKLDTTLVPARDSYALAARLRNKGGQPLPHTTGSAPGDFQVGHNDVFHISDIESRTYYTISATVRKVTEHAYWYTQDNQPTNGAALERIARVFEESIYPTNRALFGSEWTPGVDGDPRITVLLAPLRGAGGAFSAADEYTRNINPFSNEREMIYISTAGGWDGLESTLAHELQHMIHWNEHPNQDIWINEGASVLASAVNGYSVLGVDGDFMRDPDVQLTAWEPNPGLARPNYGAAYLFFEYLMSHYGDKVLREIIAAPEPGTEAIDTALSRLGYGEDFTGIFKKWALANLVDGRAGAQKAWTYPDREVQVSPQIVLDNYPTGYSGQVAQFGTNYIELTAPTSGDGRLHVDFSAQTETGIIPAPARSGTSIWWSNRGDLADTTMTRHFDLTRLKTATLDCYIWFDIEHDFDYAYIEASTDGGATWETLEGKHTTSSNPNGTNYGHAYTGKSSEKPGADANGWLHEQVDLSPYAGREVLLRFEYITDDGYNAQGIAVDDITIPELGYRDDAEGESGWQNEGFVRVHNELPQSYFLAVVKSSDSEVVVQEVEVGEGGFASFDIEGVHANGPYTEATLVIAGLTPYNLQKPSYELSVRPAK